MSPSSRDFQEKNVTLPNGLTLHYYEWPGPRPNLVLLHPSSGYGRMWEGRRTPSDRASTCTPSTSGATATAAGPTATTRRRSTPTTCTCSSGQVGIDRAIVAGQSLGGRVGQVFAAIHPEQIQGLGLVGGPHTSNFFPTREEVIKVLMSSHRMLESQTEFPSREAALEYLRVSPPARPGGSAASSPGAQLRRDGQRRGREVRQGPGGAGPGPHGGRPAKVRRQGRLPGGHLAREQRRGADPRRRRRRWPAAGRTRS